MMAGRFYYRTIVVVLALFGLGACALQPIKTVPPSTLGQLARPDVEGGREPLVLSYCYSGQLNEPAQVLESAREDCPSGKLYFQEDDVLWTKCPLIQPVRATFLCYPAIPAEPEQSLVQ